MHSSLSHLVLGSIIISAFCLGGCGSSSGGTGATSSTTLTTMSPIDVSAASASAAVTGVATDIAFAQLYNTSGTPIAWMPHLNESMSTDAISMDDIVPTTGPDGAGSPAAQDLILSTSALATELNQNAAGTFVFASDQFDPSGAVLPAGWWHVQLTFDSQAVPFSIINDDGGSAVVSSGEMNLYIHDSTNQILAGYWTRTADVYSVISVNHPLIAQITPVSGTVRTASISGIRHATHAITRNNDGTTITRTDVVTVDGDASNLINGIPSVAAFLTVQRGPWLLDLGLIPQSHYFTKSLYTATLSDNIVHTFQWDRWATFTLTKTRPSVSTTWSTIAISNENQVIYMSVDGSQTAANTRALLLTNYGLNMDMTKIGQSL